MCRILSATHLAGERGTPVLDPEAPEVAVLLGSGDVVVLLGPGSLLGPALEGRRDDLVRAELARWRALVPTGCLQVELVHHRLPGSAARAAHLARVAAEVGLPTVLTNQVRYAERRDAATADVLDAARRLVALDRRHVDRTNAEGHLKSGPQMRQVADEVAHAAGGGPSDAARLLARTRALAERCALDPRSDLGLGEVHFPEFSLSTDHPDADTALRECCIWARLLAAAIMAMVRWN